MIALRPYLRLVAALWFGVSADVALAAPVSAWLDFAGQIPGEAIETGHEDWIEAWGVGFGIDAPAPDRTVPRADAPRLSEITLSKWVDSSSPKLMTSLTDGTVHPKVMLDLNTEGGKPFARLELRDVLVTHQGFSAEAGDTRPVEAVTLSFTGITYTYTPPGGKPVVAEYDADPADPDPDSDDDGMPDAWELAHGLSVGINDAGGDRDGDGFTNIQEFRLGTRPDSGASFFSASLGPSTITPGAWEITWGSVPGAVYVIEWSPDLKTAFTPVRTVTAASATCVETLPANGVLGFYRVRPQ